MISPGQTRTRALGLAWAALLAVGVLAWLAAPDIPVTENLGNGCGRWQSAELSQHREQLALFVLLPLLVADGIAAAWVALRGANLKQFVLLAAGGLAWLLLWLWQPANPAYVWSQLLSVVVVPVVALAIVVSVIVAEPTNRERSEPPPKGTLALLALVPPFVFITLVLWTRIPWIWTC
jgi:hypothetical protein